MVNPGSKEDWATSKPRNISAIWGVVWSAAAVLIPLITSAGFSYFELSADSGLSRVGMAIAIAAAGLAWLVGCVKTGRMLLQLGGHRRILPIFLNILSTAISALFVFAFLMWATQSTLLYGPKRAQPIEDENSFKAPE